LHQICFANNFLGAFFYNIFDGFEISLKVLKVCVFYGKLGQWARAAELRVIANSSCWQKELALFT
jgi:hypothetical protein